MGMKKDVKLFGIIILTAVIGFAMAGCDDGGDGICECEPVVPVSGGNSGSGGSGSGGLGTEANPFSLSVSIWTDGSITSTASNSTFWYSFYASSGITYYVWLKDREAGQGKTLDAKMSAYYSSGESIFTGTDSAWYSPRLFTVHTSGTVKIKVEPYNTGSTGSFALVYNTSGSRP